MQADDGVPRYSFEDHRLMIDPELAIRSEPDDVAFRAPRVEYEQELDDLMDSFYVQ